MFLLIFVPLESSQKKQVLKRIPYAAASKPVLKQGASAGAIVPVNNTPLEDLIFPTNFCHHPPWNVLWKTIIIPYIGFETIAPTLYMRKLEKSVREPEHYDLRCYPYNETPTLTVNDKTHTVQAKDKFIQLSAQTEPIQMAVINHQGTQVAIVTQNKCVAIFDAASGTKIKELIHRNRVKFIGFNYDGSVMITTSWDYNIRLWNLHNGRLFKTFPGNRVLVRHAELNRDNTLLLSTADRDSNAFLWHVRNEKVTKALRHAHRTAPARFMHDGTIRTLNAQSVPTAWRCKADGQLLTKAQVALLWLLEKPRVSRNAETIEALALRNKQSEATVQAVLKSFDRKTPISSNLLSETYDLALLPTPAATAKK